MSQLTKNLIIFDPKLFIKLPEIWIGVQRFQKAYLISGEGKGLYFYSLYALPGGRTSLYLGGTLVDLVDSFNPVGSSLDDTFWKEQTL
jgi:hypothetical protein